MSETIHTEVPVERVLATWTRAQHALRARQWWSIWNLGGPVPELEGTGEDGTGLLMEFASPEPNTMQPDEVGLALFEFALGIQRFRLPAARVRIVVSGCSFQVAPSESPVSSWTR